MPSTYTLNNGIELISTGEQSGTWGDTTNTNLSLLDTALDGQVTVTLPSAGTSGSPNTLAITDGAASDGRNRMVTFADGGDLGATAFVQLTPNDSEKIIYVRNTLAGSRSIILFQGTYNASNDYEVPAGTTAVVYFDGAGSGAVAANVFNNAYFDSLRLGGVSVTAIIDDDTMGTATATNIATSESIKAYVDSQVTAQDLDFGGDSGTGAVDLDSQSLTIAGTSNEIETSASGQTLTIGLPDDVTIAGDLTVDTDTLYVDSTNNRVGIGTSSPETNLQIEDSSSFSIIRLVSSTTDDAGIDFGDPDDRDIGRVRYDNSDNSMVFTTNAAEAMRIDSSGRVGIGTSSPSADLELGGTGEVLRLSGSSTNAYIRNTDGTTNQWYIGSGGNAGLQHYIYQAQPMTFHTNGTERMRIDASGNVGIGTSSPSAALHVYQSGAGDGTVKVGNAQGGDTTNIGKQGSTTYGATSAGDAFVYTSTVNLSLMADGASSAIKFSTGGNAERMRIDSSGNVGIGTSSPSAPLSVTYAGGAVGAQITGNASYAQMQLSAAGANTNAYFTFGANGTGKGIIQRNATDVITIDSSGNVGIGTNSPTHAITVKGVNDIAKFYSDAAATELKIRTPTVNVIGLYTGTADAFTFGTADTERMRIDSSGNVGIGTSSPNTLMHISGDSSSVDGIHYIADNTRGAGGPAGIVMKSTHGDWKMINSQTVADALEFIDGSAGVTRMLIDSSGKVGIGTSSPQGNLDIDVTNVTSLGLRTNTGIIVAQYTGAPAVGNRSQIGLGYGNTYTNVSLGAVRTSAAVYGTDDFIIATKSGTGDTAPTERMRIDSSGNVGIGNSNPSAFNTLGATDKLVIGDSTDSNLTLFGTNYGSLAFADSDTSSSTAQYAGLIQYYHANNSMQFYTGSSERMRIDSSGNLLVASTNSNVAKVYAIGQNVTTNAVFAAAPTTDGYVSFSTRNAAGTQVGYIYADASGTAYNTTSDYRLKENVVAMTGATDRLKQLNPSRFNFIVDSDKTVDGFLAHEVQAVVPEAITGAKDAVDADGNPEYQGIDQSKLVPLLVATIQELEARITALENA